MADMLPKTKIVCTIGPSCESSEMVRQLILNGMRVARLNFSHGTHSSHAKKIHTIRKIARELGQAVAILQDLSGPKIRVGHIPDPGIRLDPGRDIVLTANRVEGSAQLLSVSYPLLSSQVKAGDRIMLSDGFLELEVRSVNESEIHCTIITGGVLTSYKGINLPSGTISLPCLTESDLEDLYFGLDLDVDYIGLSFVKTAEDIQQLKKIIAQQKKQTPVVAKIETHDAIRNYSDILNAADAIMVARGDLGVEMPLEKVPGIQKQLIQKANTAGKPVITATQMLRSMVDASRPTRAEASDVANAVLDGTDAVMLSEETAVGSYPVQAVRYMMRILAEAEKTYPHDRYLKMLPEKDVSDSVSYAVCVLADHLDAAAILAPTKSGRTAGHISRYRPKQPIIAYTPDSAIRRRLCLFRGVYPYLIPNLKNVDKIIEKAVSLSIDSGYLSTGMLAVITAGHPAFEADTTNMIRIKRCG